MADGNVIGEYLRARRELVRPEDVGLPDVDRRRVPGLRRSELAMLAGISTEYYVRLEQGRDRHPSTLVLDALARALQLDEHATAHLHQLAAPAPRRTRRRRTEKVSAQIDALLRSLDRATPAYVTGRLMNVLAANELATPSSSGSCRSRARTSAASGPATTSSPCTEPCPGSVSATPNSARSTSTTRSSRSRIPPGRSSDSSTRNRAARVNRPHAPQRPRPPTRPPGGAPRTPAPAPRPDRATGHHRQGKPAAVPRPPRIATAETY